MSIQARNKSIPMVVLKRIVELFGDRHKFVKFGGAHKTLSHHDWSYDFLFEDSTTYMITIHDGEITEEMGGKISGMEYDGEQE